MHSTLPNVILKSMGVVLLKFANPEKEKKLLHLMFAVNEDIEKEAFYPNTRGTFGCGGYPYAFSYEDALLRRRGASFSAIHLSGYTPD